MNEPRTPHSALIVVCCHAIFLGPSTDNAAAGSDESAEWLIEGFQKGETPTFIQHIEAGVRRLRSCLDRGDDALLVFSGGATKGHKGCAKTEGEGYLWVNSAVDRASQNLALSRNLFGLDTDPPSLRQRMFADTYATDSYQNVLLSLIQYPLFFRRNLRGYTGQTAQGIDMPLWPQTLVIVSHRFKKSRFLDLHLPAIRAPICNVEFIGIDPPFDKEKLAEVVEGDKLRGYGVWKDDPYGTGDLLRAKRLQRGWDEVAFVDQVLRDQVLWSEDSRNMLISLVKGVPDAKWPA